MKRVVSNFKRFIIPFAVTAGIIISGATNIYGMNTYYKTITESEILAKGVVYEKNQRITESGMLDVHTITVDMTNPNVSLKTINSKVDHGLKETVEKLTNDHNAIGGINGDFFGINGSYSVPLGAELADGSILSLGEASNISGGVSASFLIDTNNNPFINYISAEIHFLNNGVENIKVSHINKEYDLGNPNIITREAMTDTKKLDERVPGSAKIIVEDGIITYISQKNETVEIPENGYIVAMSYVSADEHLSKFSTGQKAELVVRTSIDLSSVKNGITGGGKILSGGAVANDGSEVVGRNQKHPRTAIGVSQDKTKVILMVADGRTHSVGASQNDMAQLMLEHGAYEAMHLDGGGSTAMTVKEVGQDKAKVVNTLSDGSARKVINALGVFNDAPVGELESLIIETEKDVCIKGSGIKLNVYGIDGNYNKINIPQDQISYLVSNDLGVCTSDGIFYPSKVGKAEIIASYGGYTGSKTLESVELAELKPNVSEIKTYDGITTQLSFTGISNENIVAQIDSQSIAYEVYPPALGRVENGIFTADTMGHGWIKCSVGDVVTYITVSSNLASKLLYDFNDILGLTGASYPDDVVAQATYAADITGANNTTIKLDYTFKASNVTQAAYAYFPDTGLPIGTKAYGLKLSVYGDNSQNMLRARIEDANGATHNITFAEQIDWTGWKEVDGQIPASVQFPVKVDRIYVVAQDRAVEITSTIYFDDLKGMVETDLGVPFAETPKGNVYKDNLRYYEGEAPTSTGDIAFMPRASVADEEKPDNYDGMRSKAIEKITTSTAKGIYMGNELLKTADEKEIKYNSGKYSVEVVNNAMIMSIGSAGGGIIQTDPSQWATIKSDIINTQAKNVLIYTDINPYNFKYNQEFELFHKTLNDARSATGKRIFVISNSGTKNIESIRDGVRYINLAPMFKSDKTLYKDYSILRFKIDGDNIKYTLEKLLG